LTGRARPSAQRCSPSAHSSRLRYDGRVGTTVGKRDGAGIFLVLEGRTGGRGALTTVMGCTTRMGSIARLPRRCVDPVSWGDVCNAQRQRCVRSRNRADGVVGIAMTSMKCASARRLRATDCEATQSRGTLTA